MVLGYQRREVGVWRLEAWPRLICGGEELRGIGEDLLRETTEARTNLSFFPQTGRDEATKTTNLRNRLDHPP